MFLYDNIRITVSIVCIICLYDMLSLNKFGHFYMPKHVAGATPHKVHFLVHYELGVMEKPQLPIR